MKNRLLIVILGGFAIVCVARSLYLANTGLPQAGDTVIPRLVREVDWEPGQDGELWVELAATNEAGRTRRLSFAASPTRNPIAHVRFYDANGEAVESCEVEISQRC